jgi:predicted DNA-binding transcriptional regulator AlpA
MSGSLTEALQPITDLLRQMFKDAVQELLDERQSLFEADEMKRKLAEINAKIYITVPEAEFLFGCSDSYFYRQLKLARAGKTEQPIPYLYPGVYIFPREELIEWMALQKPSVSAEPMEETPLKEVA